MQNKSASDLKISKFRGPHVSAASLEEQARFLLLGERIPTFAEFILDFDEELSGIEEMAWLRDGLFKIYNMYYDDRGEEAVWK